MQVMQVLSAFLIFSFFETGISQNNGCCTTKSVGEVEYRLIDADGSTAGFNCIDKCVYEQFGIPGSRFCFAIGILKVICLQKRIEDWNADVAVEIVERANEQYKKLDAETSFLTAEAKLESFLKEMTESTKLSPNDPEPFKTALALAQANFFGMPEANKEAINSGLKQIFDEIKSFMSSNPKSVTVQDVKDKVKMQSKVVHEKYSEGFMFNCEYGLSLVALVALESMSVLFLPVSQGGQGAEKTLFDAMYANTTTILPPYEASECCDNVFRAWQGSTGALIDALIKATREKFPDIKNFNDLPVFNFVPLHDAFNKISVEAGEIGSRMISSEIFKDLMNPTNK